MQAYDLLMLIVLVAAVVWGAWKGFAWQVASLASLVASYILALTFRQQVAQFISATPPWNMFLAMLILFLGTSLVVWVGFNFVAELIETEGDFVLWQSQWEAENTPEAVAALLGQVPTSLPGKVKRRLGPEGPRP